MSGASKIAKATVDQIEHHHSQVGMACRDAIRHAIEVGRLLEDVRPTLKRGDWEPWIDAHLTVGRTMARKYLTLYRNRERVRGLNTASVRKALNALTPTAPKKPKEKDGADADADADAGDAGTDTGDAESLRLAWVVEQTAGTQLDGGRFNPEKLAGLPDEVLRPVVATAQGGAWPGLEGMTEGQLENLARIDEQARQDIRTTPIAARPHDIKKLGTYKLDYQRRVGALAKLHGDGAETMKCIEKLISEDDTGRTIDSWQRTCHPRISLAVLRLESILAPLATALKTARREVKRAREKIEGEWGDLDADVLTIGPDMTRLLLSGMLDRDLHAAIKRIGRAAPSVQCSTCAGQGVEPLLDADHRPTGERRPCSVCSQRGWLTYSEKEALDKSTAARRQLEGNE